MKDLLHALEGDEGPFLVCLAGPNGAGKSTFYTTFLRRFPLHFVNADILAQEARIEAPQAAQIAEQIRMVHVTRRESFIFETVLSDPVGSKLGFLEQASLSGYDVRLVFIGLDSPDVSSERVAMRILKGGHSVPEDRIESRYPRTLDNLREALHRLPWVRVLDNSDPSQPFRSIAEYRNGHAVWLAETIPDWFRSVLGADQVR